MKRSNGQDIIKSDELYRNGKWFVISDMGTYEVYCDTDRYIRAYGNFQEAKKAVDIYAVIGG